MQDAIYASLSSNLGMHWFTEGKAELTRTGNRHGGLAECPYNVYPTSDGYIALICVGDIHWKALTDVMGPSVKHLVEQVTVSKLPESAQ